MLVSLDPSVLNICNRISKILFLKQRLHDRFIWIATIFLRAIDDKIPSVTASQRSQTGLMVIPHTWQYLAAMVNKYASFNPPLRLTEIACKEPSFGLSVSETASRHLKRKSRPYPIETTDNAWAVGAVSTSDSDPVAIATIRCARDGQRLGLD